VKNGSNVLTQLIFPGKYIQYVLLYQFSNMFLHIYSVCWTKLVIKYNYLSSQSSYTLDNLAHVLLFVQIYSLEKFCFGDTVFFCRGQELTYTLHLLKCHLFSLEFKTAFS